MLHQRVLHKWHAWRSSTEACLPRLVSVHAGPCWVHLQQHAAVGVHVGVGIFHLQTRNDGWYECKPTIPGKRWCFA